MAYTLKSSPFSSHLQIIAFVERLSGIQKVVDLGCSSGYLASIIKKRRNVSIIGIDHDAASLEEAKRSCDRVVFADLEHPFPLPDQDVDLVIMADVLEHIVHADDMMREVRRITHHAKNPYVILSVPNIANIVIRFQLFFGRFTYTERGILDRTHVRFYTKKSILSFLARHRIELLSLAVTPIPLELALPGIAKFQPVLAILSWLLNGMTKGWKTLFGYQFIMLGRISNE